MKRTRKTAEMYQIEQKLGVPIEELLRRGTGAEVAKELGVSETTVSRWKERIFGIDELPALQTEQQSSR